MGTSSVTPGACARDGVPADLVVIAYNGEDRCCSGFAATGGERRQVINVALDGGAAETVAPDFGSYILKRCTALVRMVEFTRGQARL
ncbi:MAG: hypothetical protein H0W72_13330 [Planctomycetes bacterium]|nr:hypothetical protein [Planctomycetota bacterium]